MIDLQQVADVENSPKPSLNLDIAQSALEYRNSQHELVWQMPVDNIVLMAEYTTNEGPWLDDYLLVFVAADGDRLNLATASFYADGRDEIVSKLAERWKVKIELSLFNSTEWTSRIVWPPAMVGEQYFDFSEVQPKRLLERLRRFAFGPAYEYSPTRSVREFLLSQTPRKP